MLKHGGGGGRTMPRMAVLGNSGKIFMFLYIPVEYTTFLRLFCQHFLCKFMLFFAFFGRDGGIEKEMYTFDGLLP
jgi:hypothetical protein